MVSVHAQLNINKNKNTTAAILLSNVLTGLPTCWSLNTTILILDVPLANITPEQCGTKALSVNMCTGGDWKELILPVYWYWVSVHFFPSTVWPHCARFNVNKLLNAFWWHAVPLCHDSSWPQTFGTRRENRVRKSHRLISCSFLYCLFRTHEISVQK